MSDGIWSEWIEWGGGECPVNPETLVELKFEGGKRQVGPIHKAAFWGWASPCDITAYRYRIDDNTMTPEEAKLPTDEHIPAKRSKYHREIAPGVWVDVYDVLDAFNVTNPADAHAVKKMLMPGRRGAKDAVQDRCEAIASIERAIEIEEGRS